MQSIRTNSNIPHANGKNPEFLKKSDIFADTTINYKCFEPSQISQTAAPISSNHELSLEEKKTVLKTFF